MKWLKMLGEVDRSLTEKPNCVLMFATIGYVFVGRSVNLRAGMSVKSVIVKRGYSFVESWKFACGEACIHVEAVDGRAFC